MTTRYACGLILALCCIGCSQKSDAPPSADGSQPSADSTDPADNTPIGEAVRNINSILDSIEADHKKLPHREFDPAALATALGTDPKTHYQWVHDHTRWVPYAGLLRGARGVLLDRVGSSVDRAVLLGDLLRRAGHEVRLAHATLTPGEAADLLAGMKATQPQRPGTGAPGAGAAPVYSEAAALVNARAVPLLAAFEQVAAAGRNRGDSSAVEALRDHWWVEYRAGGKWVALDLLAAAADAGRARATASHSYAWEAANEQPPVPDAEWHSVKLNVVVERYDGSATTESTVLEQVLRPAEVLGMRVALTHYPTPWPEEFPFSVSQPNALADAVVQVRQWVPMLMIGDRVVDQSGVADDGNVIADPFSSLKSVAETGGTGFMVGFGEALGDGAAAPTAMTAEWLDFELHVPGSASRTIRRAIFDVLGPENRAARVTGFDASTNERLVKRYQALVGVYSVLLQPCAFTEDYVSHLAMRTFLDSRGDVRRLAAEQDPKARQRIAASIEARIEVWNPLSRLAEMRSRLGQGTADWFINEPNVLIHGAGLPVVNANQAAVMEFIDIASNSVGVRPDPALNAFRVRLRQGVVDTVAEQVALSGALDKGENPATTFALDAADGWQLIDARDVTAVEKLEWPADVEARLAEDIGAGYAAYLPRQAFQNNGRARWGWWRVDPSSGETVGVMDNGLHPAVVEKKAADMTSDEKKVYFNQNQGRWKQAQRDNNRALPISQNDRIMMNNMLQIKKEIAAGLI
jgi:hypothetical protein